MALKPLNMKVQGTAFHIEDYPSAVAVKQLKAEHARRLGSIALHSHDLGYAQAAIKTGQEALVAADPRKPNPVATLMFTAALTHYFKCFGHSKARIPLKKGTVLEDAPPEGPGIYDYFLNLRNKHIVHDENSFAQALIGVAINRQGSPRKVADILSMTMVAYLADAQTFESLRCLVDHTYNWVQAERERLHFEYGKEYERLSHAELMALSDIVYVAPDASDVAKTRGK